MVYWLVSVVVGSVVVGLAVVGLVVVVRKNVVGSGDSLEAAGPVDIEFDASSANPSLPPADATEPHRNQSLSVQRSVPLHLRTNFCHSNAPHLRRIMLGDRDN